jgi:hypothetical protein
LKPATRTVRHGFSVVGIDKRPGRWLLAGAA